VINLEVFGESAAMAAVAAKLDAVDGVSRVRLVAATRPGHAVVVAGVRPRRADEVLAELRTLGVPDADVTLTRAEVVGRAAHPETSLIWEDVLGMAGLNARPVARYLAIMFVAGVIGCYGVVDRNGILIVGAMAVSPDLLPITAIAVGLVGLRIRLAWHALLTLAVGMALASAAAAIFTYAQNRFGVIPSGFSIDAPGLGGLTSVSDETLVVALAAGVAGMLALETRASSGVGVAISVTTIPAAAYLGVAAGLGDVGHAEGALAVLGANVAMLVLSASLTLALQRQVARRLTARRSQTAA
jgi:uncharacterized hydrophobic protein (TIGR00271 family)